MIEEVLMDCFERYSVELMIPGESPVLLDFTNLATAERRAARAVKSGVCMANVIRWDGSRKKSSQEWLALGKSRFIPFKPSNTIH